MSNFNSICETIKGYIECEVLREVGIKSSVFWDIRVKQCSRYCFLLHAGFFFGLLSDIEGGGDTTFNGLNCIIFQTIQGFD
jgi:hypothetical protein